MTENSSADATQSRQAGFVRYCPKVRDSFYIPHISGEKEIYDLAVRADLGGYVILADLFLIRNLWESFCGSFISGVQDAW